jgi:hypothetical protein
MLPLWWLALGFWVMSVHPRLVSSDLSSRTQDPCWHTAACPAQPQGGIIAALAKAAWAQILPAGGKSVGSPQTTLCLIPEDRTLQNPCCENLKSYIFWATFLNLHRKWVSWCHCIHVPAYLPLPLSHTISHSGYSEAVVNFFIYILLFYNLLEILKESN